MYLHNICTILSKRIFINTLLYYYTGSCMQNIILNHKIYKNITKVYPLQFTLKNSLKNSQCSTNCIYIKLLLTVGASMFLRHTPLPKHGCIHVFSTEGDPEGSQRCSAAIFSYQKGKQRNAFWVKLE